MRSFVTLLLLIAPFHSLAVPVLPLMEKFPLMERPIMEPYLEKDADFIKTKCDHNSIIGGSATAQRQRLYCLYTTFQWAIGMCKQPYGPGRPQRPYYWYWVHSDLRSQVDLKDRTRHLFGDYLRFSPDGESAYLKWEEAAAREYIQTASEAIEDSDIEKELKWAQEQIPTSQLIIIAYKNKLLPPIQSEKEGELLWKLVSNAMVILLHSTSAWLWMEGEGYISTSTKDYDVRKKLTELNEYAFHELAVTFRDKEGGTLGRMSTKAVSKE